MADNPDIGTDIHSALESYRSDPLLTPLLTEQFIRRMEIFGSALALWGTRINLTARPQDPAETAFHIVDSLMPLALVLSLCPQSVVGEGEGSDTLQALSNAFTSGNRILDFGAGAGFPGLILASACPAHFTLIEARHKRASFLKVAAAEMELDNVEILTARLTPAAVASRFDAVLSRASGPAVDFYRLAASSLVPHGLAILYANPSQRLELASATEAGLSGYRRYGYSLRRGAVKVNRVLVVWLREKKAP